MATTVSIKIKRLQQMVTVEWPLSENWTDLNIMFHHLWGRLHMFIKVVDVMNVGLAMLTVRCRTDNLVGCIQISR
jgi:hypothetical protein